MSEDAPAAELWTRPFLLVWALLPVALVLTRVLRLHEFDPHCSVALAALALAGLWFPHELRRRPTAMLWPIALLLLFLTPSWTAASRLSGAGWRSIVSILLVGSWLLAAWAFSRGSESGTGKRLGYFQAVFISLTALPPFLAFLSRNFGGEDWPRLASLSPASALIHLSSGVGEEWKLGAILSALVAVFAWVRARSSESSAA